MDFDFDELSDGALEIISKDIGTNNEIIYIISIRKYDLSWRFLPDGQPTSDINHLSYNDGEPCPVCCSSSAPAICPANDLIRTAFYKSVRLRGLFI
ncbi:hypothetical protein BAQ46_00590 [Bacillus paranthracis]|uniref:hypothetical protein n=1 Tax=Bacillus paranthracis TaxID=2026186 RepID=UPI0008FE3F0B|nr:hypothetical protein [Bacillus paranthracis]OJE20298.1 hypothetical protein BAQ46_00590 [Bacillus paranthracis]